MFKTMMSLIITKNKKFKNEYEIQIFLIFNNRTYNKKIKYFLFKRFN